MFSECQDETLTCCDQAEPLATTFPCLFCNHENSVSAKIDKKTGVGHLSCKVCDQNFHCSINCTLPRRRSVMGIY